jgi:aspartyl-tRNA(Asn)/glutamyl-tRNA(Gln) amidotransferase subunit A
MDTVGPLARTVEDCAVILAALAGPDPRDPVAEVRGVPDYVSHLRRPIAGLVIGRPRQYFYDDCDPEIRALMEASLETFRRLGARVVDVELPGLEAWNAAATMIISAEAAALHGSRLRSRPQDYSEQVRARIEPGYALPATAYVDSLRLRGTALAEFCAGVFSKVDVLHAPSVGLLTPTIEQSDVGGSPAMGALFGRITRLTRPANFLGVPVLCVQAGFAGSGLPVGMQLLGRPFDEGTLFALGHAFQGATDFHRRTPADRALS